MFSTERSNEDGFNDRSLIFLASNLSYSTIEPMSRFDTAYGHQFDELTMQPKQDIVTEMFWL